MEQGVLRASLNLFFLFTAAENEYIASPVVAIFDSFPFLPGGPQLSVYCDIEIYSIGKPSIQ